MDEYIERKAVLNVLASKNAPWDGYQKVSELPAADVQPLKWIPVAERLPDFEGCLLCMRKTVFGLSWQEVLYYEDGVFSYNGIDKLEVGILCGTVTHWMSLPEPPEDGET